MDMDKNLPTINLTREDIERSNDIIPINITNNNIKRMKQQYQTKSISVIPYVVMPGSFFHIPYSAKGYKTKQEIKDARLSVMTVKESKADAQLSFNQLIKLIESGHEFFPVTGVKRSERCFIYSNVIPIDIDESNISLDNFLYWLENKNPNLIPSIAYETFSSTTENPRFRLLYLFGGDVSFNKYKRFYNYFVSNINKVFPDIIPDKSFNSAVQRWDGTNKGVKFCSYRVFFNLTNVMADLNEQVLSQIKTLEDFKIIEKNYNKVIDTPIGDILDEIHEQERTFYESEYLLQKSYLNNKDYKQLIDDSCNLQPTEFIAKYKDVYTIYKSSEKVFPDGITKIETPSDYIDLNWFRNCKGGKVYKLKDGSHRRLHLSLFATALRVLNNDIRPEELYYNLVNERLCYYDNSIDKIMNKELVKITNEVMLRPLSDCKDIILNLENRPSYLIDSSVRKSVGSVKGHKPTRSLTFRPEIIDWKLSCKENYLIQKGMFPDLKECTFKGYFSKHKPIWL